MPNQNALRFIEQQLLEEQRRILDYSSFIGIITNAKMGEQKKILKAIQSRAVERTGRFVLDLVSDELQKDAKNEARSILVDNILNSAEIDKVFKNV